ncbi:hypothetical protein LCGC14_1431140 [marine sediment metagenome]|uniref:Uncharacterized protein n=1 Tax=marine sediment metagenome TaxID=412755 RepID=A0A0F9K9R6_9ZZZZ
MNPIRWMKGLLRFLTYMVWHKWYVFRECCRSGIPILGLLHDLSKFRPSESLPYITFFAHSPVTVIPLEVRTPAIKKSMLLHTNRNKHHWQWWVLPYAPDGMTAFPMERKYVLEMVADWRGAGRAQGNPDTAAWYRENGSKMMLHPETRLLVEQLLGLED